MHQGKPIGVIGLPRSHVDPFSEHEIDVVTTFAEQTICAVGGASGFHFPRDTLNRASRMR